MMTPPRMEVPPDEPCQVVELPTPVSHCPRAAFSIRRRVERRVSFGIQCHTCLGAKNFQCPPLLRNIRIGKQVCNTSSVASWCSSARIRPYSDVVCPLPIAPCSSHVTVHLRSERCSTIITGTVHELLAPARCPRMLALMAARLVASVPRVPMSHTLLNHRRVSGSVHRPLLVHRTGTPAHTMSTNASPAWQHSGVV